MGQTATFCIASDTSDFNGGYTSVSECVLYSGIWRAAPAAIFFFNMGLCAMKMTQNYCLREIFRAAAGFGGDRMEVPVV